MVNVKKRKEKKTFCNFTLFPGVGILGKGTVSAKFQANRPKLYGNCAFPQNSHTRKLGENTVFYAVLITKKPSNEVYRS